MKTYIIFALLLISSLQAKIAPSKLKTSSTQPSTPTPTIQVVEETIPYTITPRFSYQWFQSPSIREIYGQTIDYQLTGTIPTYQGKNFELRGLNVWWAVDYTQANGHSLGLNNKTKIQIEPIALGLKWIYPKSIFRPYFGLAFKYFFTQTRNDSPYVKKHLNFNGAGFVLETGFWIFLSKYLFLDFFGAYSWKVYKAPSGTQPNIIPTSLNISAINAGGGLGVKF